jgi:integrase
MHEKVSCGVQKASMARQRRRFGTIRRLPSKRYQVRYVGPDGIAHLGPRTFLAKADAERFLQGIEIEIHDGTWVSPSEKAKMASAVRRFKEFALDHIELQTSLKGQPLEKSTKALYERLLMLHLRDFHDVPLVEISKQDVDRWWAKTVPTGKTTTAGKAYTLMFSVMKRAVSDGIIPVNPCKIVGARSASTGKRVGSPNVDELWLIAENIDQRFRFLILISGYCALRFSEAVALRKKDIRPVFVDGVLHHFEVHITRAIKKAKGELYVGAPKSASGTRTIPIPEWLTIEVRDWLDDIHGSDEALLFRSGDGNSWLRHDVFIKHWNRTLAKCDLMGKGLTPHSLRHFGGTAFTTAGATIPNLKALMGSSSMNSIQRYLHEDEEKSAIVNLMPKPKNRI